MNGLMEMFADVDFSKSWEAGIFDEEILSEGNIIEEDL